MAKNKVGTPVAIAIVVIVVLAIAAGGYYYLNGPKEVGPNAARMMAAHQAQAQGGGGEKVGQ